jgi:SAM-dependent methyltransferase
MNTDGWLEDTRTSYDKVAVSYARQLRDALAGKPYLRAALALFADVVRTVGGGPVADVDCGPGHVTAHLHELGINAFGVDLSPAMIDVARRDHPGLRFEVGSMTDLRLADASVTALRMRVSSGGYPDNQISAPGSTWSPVLDAAALAEGVECFFDREQLGGRHIHEGPGRGYPYNQARGHDIVGRLHEHESVGVPERVPKAVQFPARGFDDRAKRCTSILRIGQQSGPRLGCVAEPHQIHSPAHSSLSPSYHRRMRRSWQPGTARPCRIGSSTRSVALPADGFDDHLHEAGRRVERYRVAGSVDAAQAGGRDQAGERAGDARQAGVASSAVGADHW